MHRSRRRVADIEGIIFVDIKAPNLGFMGLRKMLNKMLALLAVVNAMAFGANITYYTDSTSFLGAINPTQTINFEGLAPSGGSADYSSASGLTIGGVNFAGPTVSETVPNPPVDGFALAVIDSASSPLLTDFGTGATLWGPGTYQTGTFAGTSGSLIITLPANTDSIGLNLSSIGIFSGVILGGSVGNDLAVSVDGGTPFVVHPIIKPGFAFAGFVSDGSISTIEISSAGSNTFRIVADNVLLSSSPVPEPASLILMGIGAICVVGYSRRGCSELKPFPSPTIDSHLHTGKLRFGSPGLER